MSTERHVSNRHCSAFKPPSVDCEERAPCSSMVVFSLCLDVWQRENPPRAGREGAEFFAAGRDTPTRRPALMRTTLRHGAQWHGEPLRFTTR